MTGTPGVYSIIQFVPAIARGEGVNVGVVVLCPGMGRVAARMSDSNEDVKRRMGAGAFDDRRLASAKRAIERRLTALPADTAAFEDFLAREAGSLIIMPPRPILVEDLDQELNFLFDSLVGKPPSARRHDRQAKPRLESFFKPLFVQRVPIQRDYRVDIPVLGKEIRAEFAYRNGSMNMIKAKGFGSNAQGVITAAEDLAVQGQMLAKHPPQLLSGVPHRLIVVGKFRRPELAKQVSELFGDFQVRLIRSDDMPAFVEEIRNAAHT